MNPWEICRRCGYEGLTPEMDNCPKCGKFTLREAFYKNNSAYDLDGNTIWIPNEIKEMGSTGAKKARRE